MTKAPSLFGPRLEQNHIPSLGLLKHRRGFVTTRTTLFIWIVAAVGAFGLTGCSSAAPVNTLGATSEAPTDLAAKGRDAVALATLARHAAQQARKVSPDAILRQVDLNGDGSQYTFRFADYTTGRDVDVFVPAAGAAAEEYRVVPLDLGYLAVRKVPEMELGALRVGPAAVGKAATDHWDGCDLRSLSISGQGQELFWYVFCELPEGVVSGTVDNESGVFQPFSAPPARIPSTATPTTP